MYDYVTRLWQWHLNSGSVYNSWASFSFNTSNLLLTSLLCFLHLPFLGDNSTDMQKHHSNHAYEGKVLQHEGWETWVLE